MKLKKLEIAGFKSFNDKASIAFPPGISAIVGPNGCGKSNVIDAIRWVMGEQSVKQLRGKAMADVIFSGTNGHAPLNMAEVSLTLLNDNGSAPEELKDFTEIMLTRRVYRSGERSYFINRQPCRLKDIYNIFYGSGMGPKSYAVIQQGNIGAITDAGPEERRYFIEEAAGVTRYKNRKKEALQKVHSTNQNLLRLNDILSEIKRQMTALKRQAKKAERFKKYQERIRTLDALFAIASHDRLTGKIQKADALLKEMKDEDMGHSARLRKIDAAVEQIKLQKERKNQEISEQKAERFEKQRALDRLETNLSHYRDDVERLAGEITGLESAQQDLEAKHTEILSEIDQVENQNTRLNEQIGTAKTELERERAVEQEVSSQLKSLTQKKEAGKARLYELVAREAQYRNIFQNASNNKESLQRRLKRASEEELVSRKLITQLADKESQTRASLEELRTEIDELQELIDTAKTELGEKSTRLGRQVKRVQELEIERNKIRSRYTTLKKMEENFEWYRDGVKAVMRIQEPETGDSPGPDPSSVLGLMADIIEPDPSYERAVDAVLGESLQYILVRDQQAGVGAIDYLQSHGAGRSGFIPVSTVRPVAPDPENGSKLCGRILDHVKVKKGFEKISEAVLGHVRVAGDMTEALAVFNRNGIVQTIVTLQGDVINHQGILLGGSPDKLSGILAKKTEIRNLKRELETVTASLATAKDDQKVLESELRLLESRLQQHIETKNQAVQEEIDTEKELYKVGEDGKHARRRLEIVRLETEQLRGEASDLEAEMSKYDQAVSDIQADIQAVQEEVSHASEAIETVSDRMEGHNQNVMDLKLALTTANAELEHSNHTLRRLEEYKNDTRDRFSQLTRDISLKTQKRESTQRQIGEDEKRLSELYAGIKIVEEKLETDEADFLAIDTRLKENDSSISQIQTQREELLQKIRILELDRSELRMKRESIEKRMEEQYRSTISNFRAEFRTRSEDMAEDLRMSRQELSEHLDRYKDRISRITDVNLAAISEYDQLKERFDFLTEQRDDLVSAVDDLHQVIRKINRITQEKFISTFNLINEKLDEVFPRLFEGGTAKLMLTDPNAPLETGVEFMIHPPGKKLTRLSLLSGGEKALSAIAFIFSIFLIKPASFCLLDEIDAPLDEANIFRFNNLLQLIGEKSQVVMITHNKRSMEFADTLFGITMEKKGVSKVVSVNLQ